MYNEQQTKVSEIKEQVAQGTYSVDSRAVADAIMRRLAELAEQISAAERQQERAA
jgi:anti-sigma28 factor (negative regulator of flagellin synthesis)